jgi:acyl-coenzyme A synthetase/AMP-(fatty) acid ligase
MSEREAARALRMFLDAGGRLGPEAWRYWSDEVRRLPLDRAHTPWRAAASPRHVGPFVARRRELERAEHRERTRSAQDRVADRQTHAAPIDLKERLRQAESRLRGPP